MNSVFDEHFVALRERYPNASFETRPDGSRLVRIPDYPLPQGGWNKAKTSVYFLALTSYPQAKPDCFWADQDLRLAGNVMPLNASENNAHGGPHNLLWFSWHVATWNPNTDSLLTYLRVIDKRFKEFR